MALCLSALAEQRHPELLWARAIAWWDTGIMSQLICCATRVDRGEARPQYGANPLLVMYIQTSPWGVEQKGLASPTQTLQFISALLTSRRFCLT